MYAHLDVCQSTRLDQTRTRHKCSCWQLSLLALEKRTNQYLGYYFKPKYLSILNKYLRTIVTQVKPCELEELDRFKLLILYIVLDRA
jgi:hypothetical protein